MPGTTVAITPSCESMTCEVLQCGSRQAVI
jgi:hypothetical protein